MRTLTDCEESGLSRKPRKNRALECFEDACLGDAAFQAQIIKMSAAQLQNLASTLQSKINATTNLINQGQSAYAGPSHFGGMSADQFSGWLSGQANTLQTYQDQLSQVLAYLQQSGASDQPIDKRSLVDIYGETASYDVRSLGSLERGAHAGHGGFGMRGKPRSKGGYGSCSIVDDPEKCSSLTSDFDLDAPRLNTLLEEFFDLRRKKYSKRRTDASLDGWLSNIGHNIANVVRDIPVIGNPLTRYWRYASAAGLNPFIGGPFASMFLPASTRARMFGLNPEQSAQFETLAKVERGVSAAVAATVTGLGVAGALPGGASSAGAAEAAAESGQLVPAVAGVPVPSAAAAQFMTPEASQAATALGAAPTINPLDAAVPARSFGDVLFGVKSGVSTASDLTAKGASSLLGALGTTAAILKAGEEVITLTRGPNGQINAASHPAASIPGSSQLANGMAYPAGGGVSNYVASPAGTGGDTSSLSSLDLSSFMGGAGAGGGAGSQGLEPAGKATPPKAAGSSGSAAVKLAGAVSLAIAAAYYYKPNLVRGVVKKIEGGIRKWRAL
jgi:uncharacterized protein YukE